MINFLNLFFRDSRLPAANYQIPTRSGFTLLEMLLTITFITVLAGVSIPLWRALQLRTDSNAAQQILVGSLRRAQLLSQAVMNDSPWGVKIQTGTITVFSGSNFAIRDQTRDEIMEISPHLAISGWSEVVFSKLDGAPSSIGDTIFSDLIGESRTTTINGKGIAIY